jgi:hypothetical protein
MGTYGLNAETIAQLLDLPLEFFQEMMTQLQQDDSLYS